MDKADITKIAALVIKDKKVLIVKAEGKDFWSSLGGKIEGEESHIVCLTREIKEEVGMDLASAKLFLECPILPTDNHDGRTIKNYFYLVDVSGEIKLNPEDQIVDTHWLSKEEFEGDSYKIGAGLKEFAIPKLIEANLL